MAVILPLEGQLQMVRSTLFDWSADCRMLPNSCEGEPPSMRAIRSKSFTSCFAEAVKPAGSVQARTKVTGMQGEERHGVHETEKAEDSVDNCMTSDV